MTNEQRKKVSDTLLHHGIRFKPEDFLIQLELEKIVADDVEQIEPIIDEFERQAELRGRVQCLLELWAKHEERRQKVFDHSQ